jgi:hypothetical protein
LALFKDATSWGKNFILNTHLAKGRIVVDALEKKIIDFILKYHKL